MKKNIIKLGSGAMGYNKKILGYTFSVFVTRDKRYSMGAPMGKTKKEIRMFDSLVYYNQKVYHGDNEKEVVEKIKKFIKNWKTL